MKRLLSIAIVMLLALVPAGAVVNSQVNKTIALGNGSATQFTFSFIGVAAQYITVTFTDAGGNSTVLTQGAGATQYQISLNPPVTGALWGMGGTVTYNPNGTPIASGTTLTILRTLPLTQAQSLQNQPSVGVLGTGAETATDTVEMQLQQVNETSARAILANPTNPSAPLPLPPAAQVANLGLCFDGSGSNVIGCALAPAGTISSAMQPVVNAASLALGRTAFGLGTLATENIGAGLQDDGAGNARVSVPTQSVAINFAITAASHQVEFEASGALTGTVVRLNTLWNGYTTKIRALTAAVIFAIDANDTVAGQSSGQAFVIPAGSIAEIIGNGAASGTWWISLKPVGPRASQTHTNLTSGSGTFVPQTSTRRIVVRMVGGAGGGGGAGTGGSSGGNGGTGGTSSFNSIVANAGTGGAGAGAAFGSPGVGGSGGSGSAALRISGGGGAFGLPIAGGEALGGLGGSSAFGGAGSPTGAAGGAGAANSGAGGAGGSSSTASSFGGGGGGSGEYVELVITSPAASYAYTVGAAGTAGAAGAGSVGGAGSLGVIIIDEYSY